MSAGLQNGFFGIEIGGTKLQLVAADETLTLRERHRFSVDSSRGASGIRAQIEDAIGRLRRNWKALAVGVGFGGPVDWRTGKICCSHHVEGWSEFPLGEWLHTLTEAPVIVDNDANTAALGEAARGAGIGCNPVFYVTLGSGVGGGLIVNGSIYHGATPGEAEIGHLRLDKQGTILEKRCSGWAVDAKIRQLRSNGEQSLLWDLIGNSMGGEAKYLGAALEKRDGLALRILKETAEDLAFGLSHVTQLFHPEMIVVGGGLSLLGEQLRRELERALLQFTMEAFAPGPAVRLAGLGEDSVPVGACVAAQRLLAQQ
ncbi:MAG TPA: ROK family protein [Candidatus Saccharimonadales bacterium]|nr:ROK family protein [Candidatus Saccharimonadales bacterium]